MPQSRTFSAVDHLLMGLDLGLRTCFGQANTTTRANPAEGLDEPALDEAERRLASRLMRVNHAGEVAAQGLYQGQALTASRPQIQQQMAQAALEENDHLAWCKQRTLALGSHTSVLDPVWFSGSVAIGAIAGAIGDQWSLGFIAETERQVVQHLDRHLHRLPKADAPSRAILSQMKIDEGRHATNAVAAGAAVLPYPVRWLMRGMSKVMTRAAFWL